MAGFPAIFVCFGLFSYINRVLNVKMPNWFVYMILTDRSNLYTGISTDPKRRFDEHLDVFLRVAGAKGAKFFRTQKPINLVYCELCGGRAEASQLERKIKNLSKRQKLALLT
jgi:putative endonuclease